ncbi:pfh1, partial [Symbiodinium necroappetens]
GACTPEKTQAPEQEGTLETTYLIPKELKAPRPQNTDLQKARSIAALSDDMDVKFFPHLFPAGTGGWQNGYGSMSQYARKRLLGLDPRFEASPAYIMWLLEMHIKKRLSGNINVRIGGQPPSGKSKYQEGRGQVFTALRDIPGTSAASRMEDEADAQDQPEDTLEEDFIQAPAADSAGQHRGVRKEDPPFRVVDYLIRIEWQKRGYPHAHILLWVVEWENKKNPDHKTKPAHEDKEAEAEAQVPDWSDDEAMKHFTPTCAEDWSDKYITTKGPLSWRQSTKVSARDKELNAQLAELLVHKHTEYCGIKTHGACRFGFPHRPEPRTRRRSSQEKYANSRWKSSLATRRAECDKGMGQYNIKILRRWRASMDLQVICELTSASRYILGYALKSEQDQEAQRRVESIVASLTSSSAADASLSNQQIYKAAHAALQGRTTSTFEACHLLLGFPVVQFSRDNEWIQVGPPETWTLSVPKYEESAALQRPDSYRRSKVDRDGYMPVAQRWYREMQKAFSEQEVNIPVEGGKLTTCRFRDLNFLDFCAAFKFIGVDFPQSRKRPAIVAYRNFSPDEEPEAFYYSRLMLYTVWKDPGDWLREEDGGSHAVAFRRLAKDVDGNPGFLRSRCFPQMDGTVN